MRRTGAPTQADSRGRGRPGAAALWRGGGTSFPLPAEPEGQEPAVPRGLRVAGQGRPWLGRRPGRGRGGGGGGGDPARIRALPLGL